MPHWPLFAYLDCGWCCFCAIQSRVFGKFRTQIECFNFLRSVWCGSGCGCDDLLSVGFLLFNVIA